MSLTSLSHVEFKKWLMANVTCHFMAMSHVDFQKMPCHAVEFMKWPCHCVEFRGLGSYVVMMSWAIWPMGCPGLYGLWNILSYMAYGMS